MSTVSTEKNIRDLIAELSLTSPQNQATREEMAVRVARACAECDEAELSDRQYLRSFKNNLTEAYEDWLEE